MDADGKVRRAGVIGAAVAVATAGVVVLVATTGKPDEEPVRSEPPRQIAVPKPPSTLPPPPPSAPPSTKPPPDDRQAAIDQAMKADGAFASLTGTGDIYGGLIGTDHYGVRGWGPGARGPHGAGAPKFSLGLPSVTPADAAGGELDKAIVRRYLKRNSSKFTYCYEKELLVKPTLAGTVTTGFTILPSGYVASATASGVDPKVATCISTVLGGIQYPKPKHDGAVKVTMPFTFRPN